MCAGTAAQWGRDLEDSAGRGTLHGSQALPQQGPPAWEWLLLAQCPSLHLPKAVAAGFTLPKMLLLSLTHPIPC